MGIHVVFDSQADELKSVFRQQHTKLRASVKYFGHRLELSPTGSIHHSYWHTMVDFDVTSQTFQSVGTAVSIRLLDEDVIVVGFVALETRVATRLRSDEAKVAHEDEHRSVDKRNVEAVFRLHSVVDGAQTSVEVSTYQLAVARSQGNHAVVQVRHLEQTLG